MRVSVPAVFAAAWVLAVCFLPLMVVLVVVDLVRTEVPPAARPARDVRPLLGVAGDRRGCSLQRACGSPGGPVTSAAHFRLQRWWADRLMTSLRVTCGITIHVEGAELLRPGADGAAGPPRQPRRLAAHGVGRDRACTAAAPRRAQARAARRIRAWTSSATDCRTASWTARPRTRRPGWPRSARWAPPWMTARSSIIFPEGTRANPDKRRRALERIARARPGSGGPTGRARAPAAATPGGDPGAARGRGRPSMPAWWSDGTSGFDGLDTFAGILAALARPRTPIRMRFARVDGAGDLRGRRLRSVVGRAVAADRPRRRGAQLPSALPPRVTASTTIAA